MRFLLTEPTNQRSLWVNSETNQVHVLLQLPKLLLQVARGQQDEANNLLGANTEVQLLRQKGEFTDYSGRTFHCTAYEYAYWAKDTHMCRMLEQHMDDRTKAEMLILCEAIERDGLDYTQDGEGKNSKHFDFTPLKTALQEYVKGHPIWVNKKNWDAMKAAWMKVGKAQRDVPAHVAHEYCCPTRSFHVLLNFDERFLPRVLTFYNWDTECKESWFPLGVSTSSGLGFDFATSGAGGPWWACTGVVDLAAVTRLDKVRTAELTHLREKLMQSEPTSDLGLSI